MLNGMPRARRMPVIRWVMDVSAPTGIWIRTRSRNTGLRLLLPAMPISFGQAQRCRYFARLVVRPRDNGAPRTRSESRIRAGRTAGTAIVPSNNGANTRDEVRARAERLFFMRTSVATDRWGRRAHPASECVASADRGSDALDCGRKPTCQQWNCKSRQPKSGILDPMSPTPTRRSLQRIQDSTLLSALPE